MTLVRFTVITFALGLVLGVVMFLQRDKFSAIDAIAVTALLCNVFLQRRLMKKLNRVPFSWGFYGINILYVMYFLCTTHYISYNPPSSYIRLFEIMGLQGPQELWVVFFAISYYAFFTAAFIELAIVTLFLAKYREIKVS
ncbi:hypothetical protein FUA48_11205 [Flavobacterium alkalisoli]|uniref:Uncharacterized protein n=1 Tax=Flavobacterium alkalisoli TaxID=2602769 RepID=A0A5B9FZD5_9FLAO|nr:hypothetical protein [Flavobacterium alkalisoli]QEE50127.1 hypothetical protein FUA48_11205 [Flavobacterium alkalisoli]